MDQDQSLKQKKLEDDNKILRDRIFDLESRFEEQSIKFRERDEDEGAGFGYYIMSSEQHPEASEREKKLQMELDWARSNNLFMLRESGSRIDIRAERAVNALMMQERKERDDAMQQAKKDASKEGRVIFNDMYNRIEDHEHTI